MGTPPPRPNNAHAKVSLCVLAVCILLVYLPGSSGECPNGCSGHGICNITQICTCSQGWIGPDCSLRGCPTGKAWFDFPSAIDVAHADGVECSNMGLCDRKTGLCACAAGYEGLACDRMKCPVDESGLLTCSGHGRCLSMEQTARLQDDVTLFSSFTYANWDANMIYGCVCDEFWAGHDCALRSCPKGQNPTIAGVDEIQVVDCVCTGTCSGTFTLTYAGETTDPISYNAVTSISDEDSSSNAGTGVGESVQAKLQALRKVDGVTVSMTGSGSCPSCPVCDATGVSTAITFTNNPGALPVLRAVSSLASDTSTAPTLAIRSKGTAGDQGGTSSRTGTRTAIECSGRGVCDTALGLCTCQADYIGSNGAGGAVALAAGTRNDCGYPTVSVGKCPEDDSGVACGGHGTCSGASAWTCACASGYTGPNCVAMTCPTGRAWHDEATADNTAHAQVECSGRGLCDITTGTCSCSVGFSGTACQRFDCANGCSGRGTCRSMNAAAPYARDNGNLMGMTYGASGGEAVWDKDSVYGCQCDDDAYNGPYILSVTNNLNYDCNRRSCPTGDDPYYAGMIDHTGTDEVQIVRCTATAGTFTLTFRDHVSDPIQWNAVAKISDEDGTSNAASGTGNSVQSKLIKMVTYDLTGFSIASSTVSFSTGAVACSSSGVDISITLPNELGDIPMMTADVTALTGSVVIMESVKGTKFNLECSNRGLCDEATGICKCFAGFTSSDGNGNAGARGDCGYISMYQTSNPYPL